MTDERGARRVVAVVGATGQVGRRVVQDALARGFEVRGVSRSVPTDHVTAPATATATAPDSAVTYAAADVVGPDEDAVVAALADAFADADAVVVATNANAGSGLDVYTTGTRRVVAAAERAGVRRLVVLSIVGVTTDSGYPYYGAHATQNEIALAGLVPATVVRATQFHTFLGYVRTVPPLHLVTRAGLLPYPRGIRFQPIDVRDVARLLLDATADEGASRTVDVGGPEIRDAKDLVRAWKRARGSRKVPFGIPMPGAVGRFFRAGHNLVPEHREGRITFEQWLASDDGD